MVMENPYAAPAKSSTRKPEQIAPREKCGYPFLDQKFWLISFLVLFAATTSFLLVDVHAQRFTAGLNVPGDARAILGFFSYVGNGIFVLFVAMVVWFLDLSKRKLVVFIAGAAILAGLTTTAIKHTIKRERPMVAAGVPAGVDERNKLQSFPSGHTATAFALAASLSVLYPHGRKFFIGMAIGVGLQRVISQAHYPSDVFFGAFVGLLAVHLIGVMFQQKLNWFTTERN